MHSCCVEAIQLIQMKTTLFFLVECVVFLLGEFSNTKRVVAAQCGELAAVWLWCGCNVKLLSVGGVPWQGSQTLIRVTQPHSFSVLGFVLPGSYLVLGGLSFTEPHLERKSKTSYAESVFSGVSFLFWVSAFLHEVLHWHKGR